MIGVPEAIRWTKFYKGCTKFCEGCTKGSKVCYEVGIDHESLPYGSQMKLWTLGDKLGVPKAIGLEVPNFIKDVPNFVKDLPNFVKDEPRVPKCIPRWG